MFALFRVVLWERDGDEEYVVGAFEGTLWQVSQLVRWHALSHHRLVWSHVGFYR